MPPLPNASALSTDAYPPLSPLPPVPGASSTNPKKMFGIAAATLLLGGAAWAISQKIVGSNDQSEPDSNASNPERQEATPTQAALTLPADVDVAGKVSDRMSFEQAFRAARNEVVMGGVFSWHGHWYNTFEKEEWGSLSLEQRREYTEMILQEKLPIETPPVHKPISGHQLQPAKTEPTVIEGFLNGQRTIGLDFDHDGIIDSMVVDGSDGYEYRVVDQTGDDGLDTVYQYNSLTGELMAHVKFDKPFVLTNDQFSDHLEANMSKEIVASILEPETASSVQPMAVASINTDSESEHSESPADSYEDDDSYVNNGDVHEMDE